MKDQNFNLGHAFFVSIFTILIFSGGFFLGSEKGKESLSVQSYGRFSAIPQNQNYLHDEGQTNNEDEQGSKSVRLGVQSEDELIESEPLEVLMLKRVLEKLNRLEIICSDPEQGNEAEPAKLERAEDEEQMEEPREGIIEQLQEAIEERRDEPVELEEGEAEPAQLEEPREDIVEVEEINDTIEEIKDDLQEISESREGLDISEIQTQIEEVKNALQEVVDTAQENIETAEIQDQIQAVQATIQEVVDSAQENIETAEIQDQIQAVIQEVQEIKSTIEDARR